MGSFREFDRQNLAGDGLIGNLGILYFGFQPFDIGAGVDIAFRSEVRRTELDPPEVIAIEGYSGGSPKLRDTQSHYRWIGTVHVA